MKNVLIVVTLIMVITGKAQICGCEKEFLYIKNTVEQNFSGFPDKIKTLTKEVYVRKVDELLKLTSNPFASDNCPLIISKYLDIFKSHHLGFSPNFDPYQTDTNFVNHRPLMNLTDEQIANFKKSRSWEGIYIFAHDSSTKIAVVKDPTALHDYIGVTLESTRPTWKKACSSLKVS